MHKMLGTKHIILLIISAVLIIALYLLSRKLKHQTLCKILFGLAIVCEIIKTFFYISNNESSHNGILPKTDLPFQLCSIQLIFIAIVLFTKKESVKRLILSFMLPSCLFGGIAAIAIPAYSSLNHWIITIQYFSYHIGLIVFALHLFKCKEYKWTAKDFVNCLIFLVCILFFAIYINSIVDDGSHTVNFMYVVAPPQDGLPYLNKDQGWLAYMLKYASLVIVCVSLCYIKPIITWFKSKSKKSTIVNENQETENTDKKEN